MPWYFFDVSDRVPVNDTVGRDVDNHRELRRQALLEAASAASRNAQHGDEAGVIVTVRDLTGAVHLKVRLVSQVETP